MKLKLVDFCRLEEYRMLNGLPSWRKYILPILGIIVFIIFVVLVAVKMPIKQPPFVSDGTFNTDFEDRDLDSPKIFQKDDEQFQNSHEDFEPKNGGSDLVFVDSATGKCICESQGDCNIQCSDYKSLKTMIEDINNTFKVCKRLILKITTTNFPNQTLEEGWLSDLNMLVTQLELTQTNIVNLAPRAISGKKFTELKYLTIEASNIRHFRKDMFDEDIPINTLEIRNNEFLSIKFDSGVFDNIRTSLNTLQVSRCLHSSEALANITGSTGSKFSQLASLDLRYNSIPYLKDDVFVNATSVQSLYLDHSGIEVIDQNTFLRISSLKKLTLSFNKLSTLPDGVFNKIQGSNAIDVRNNSWVCDCKLSWLKDMYLKTRKFCPQFCPLYCYNIESMGIDFNHADFCPNSSTESSTPESSLSTSTREASTNSPTASPTRITTSSPDDDLMVIACREAEITTSNMDMADSILLRKGKVNFRYNLNELTDKDVSYTISINGVDYNNEFLLLRKIDQRDITCIKLSEHDFKVNVEYGEIYSVCLYVRPEELVNVYDCTALAPPQRYEDQAWLTNRSKTYFIVGLSLGCLLLVILTALVVFFCIRQHPSLIKGSKRVIMVGAKSAEALVMPKNYEFQDYRPASVKSISDGYMTPVRGVNGRRYETPVMSQVLLPMYKTYYSPKPARTRRVSLGRASNSAGYSFDHVYEIPPPLPPNHPAEMGSNYRRSSVGSRH